MLGALVVVAIAAAVFELPFGITLALMFPAIAGYVYASWKAPDATPRTSDEEFRAGLLGAGCMLVAILLDQALPARYFGAALAAVLIGIDLTQRAVRRR
jgi:hypothetical protein